MLALHSYLPRRRVAEARKEGEVPAGSEGWKSHVALFGFDKYYYRKH